MDAGCRDDFITLYYSMGLRYREIVYILRTEHDISLSLRHLKRILQRLHLGRRSYHDLNVVIGFIQHELRTSGRLHGYRMMRSRCSANGLNARFHDIRLILNHLDPIGRNLRTARRFERRSYYAPGPNYIWHIDGYDKLKPYGLCISGCICGFSRKIIWLNVYYTNNNPKVIGGYFLDAIQEYGGSPRKIRGDFGTENGHVSAFQRFLRRNDNDNRRSYLDGASTANQRIESWWGHLRRQHLQFWIELFRGFQYEGDYSSDFLDRNLVQFCFLSVIQTELDMAKNMWNDHNIRPSRNSRVPSGRPNMMFHFPSLWNSHDYICRNSTEELQLCREEAEFRSVIPCDQDVYDVCVNKMREAHVVPATNAQEATDLYLYIRREIRALM